ncbi:hypothetical protein D3C71_716170 [compost metagenome]
MEDFNNIEFDPIPEGLEFNESYMQDAFALYDAEKQKRKRRILIWWLTSAMGFASILLVGLYFFTNGKSSDSADKKTRPEKTVSAQNVPVKNAAPSLASKDQINKTSATANDNSYHPAKNDETYSKKIRTAQAVSTGMQNKSMEHKTQEVPKKSRHSLKTKRGYKNTLPDFKTGNNSQSHEVNNPSERLTTQTIVPDGSDKPVEIDSSQYQNLADLPSKPALLAFNQDSVSKPVIDSLNNFPQTEVEPRKHQLFLNLGVNTIFGIKELQNRFVFRESIGLSYHYRLSQKIGIGVGLEYHSIPRISYRRIVGDTTNSDKTTTTLNKTTLNYISLFPQMTYQLWDKHKVTAGFGIEYLLTDPGERYEIENYTDESPKRTNSKLYYSTFNRFNFSVSIGYVYQFSRFMSVQALYHYGFTDITKNTSFNKTFDRNSRLQLGLKIKLL